MIFEDIFVEDCLPVCGAEISFMTMHHDNSLPSYGVLMDETRFWVVHRRSMYGPFDYQWNTDLYGIEFLYQGEKYGECCSDEEFFADLKPYRLPTRVSEVATVVTGSVIASLFESILEENRHAFIEQKLKQTGLERYGLTLK